MQRSVAVRWGELFPVLLTSLNAKVISGPEPHSFQWTKTLHNELTQKRYREDNCFVLSSMATSTHAWIHSIAHWGLISTTVTQVAELNVTQMIRSISAQYLRGCYRNTGSDIG
jgi:hypothetical protein